MCDLKPYEREFDYEDAYSIISDKMEVQTYIKKPYYYPSNTPDTFIRNAVTGIEYPWKVGSFDSQRLFKIVDSIGNVNRFGSKIKPSSSEYPNPNPNHCYYDNTQQYMSHRRNTLDSRLIEQWTEKQRSFSAVEE